MIILSVGMPRAGSGWYYNLTHDLVVAAGGQDARQVRARYHLQSILTEVNCNIGALTVRRLLAVLVPAALGNRFVLKAHAGPTPFARFLLRGGWLKAAYIYRDPRDALLSALDNGRKARARGRDNAFARLTDFSTGIEFMQEYLRIWEGWMHTPRTLHTRYEDLLADYEAQVVRLAVYLGLEAARPEMEAVIARYRPEQGQTGQKGLHFNQGRTGRFRQRFSDEERATLADHFGHYLEQMGYAI